MSWLTFLFGLLFQIFGGELPVWLNWIYRLLGDVSVR